MPRAFPSAAALLAMVLAPALAAQAPGDGGTSTFYRWTAAVPTRPGKLLRREPLAATLSLTGAARAERILYSSTRGYGPRGPAADSGAIFVPPGPTPKGGWPIIAWAHGTTGVADVCAPSWMPRDPRDAVYLNGWLAQGYAIVSADYEGLGTPGAHPYMVTDSAAFSVLDSIRAARAADPTLGSRVVVVGQSQGAHAALVTGLLAPTYAPELDIRGIVATGVPGEKGFEPAADAQASSIGRMRPIDPETPRGAVRGLTLDRFDGWGVVYLEYFASYRAVDPAFDPADWLTPRGLTILAEMTGGCKGGPASAAFFAEKPPLSAIFRRDPTAYEAAHVAARRYPDPRFKMPVFIGIGLADLYTAPELSFNVARAACLRGSAVTVHFYPGLGHSEAVVPSQADSAPFVKAALAGTPPAGNCATLRWPGRS